MRIVNKSLDTIRRSLNIENQKKNKNKQLFPEENDD